MDDGAESPRFSPEMPVLSRPAATLPPLLEEVSDPTMARRKQPDTPPADATPAPAPTASTPRVDAAPAKPVTAAPRLRRKDASAVASTTQGAAAEAAGSVSTDVPVAPVESPTPVA